MVIFVSIRVATELLNRFRSRIVANVGLIVNPLTTDWLTRTNLLEACGKAWFEQHVLLTFHVVTIWVPLITPILIFAFQSRSWAKTLDSRIQREYNRSHNP